MGITRLKNNTYRVDVSFGQDDLTGKRNRIVRKGICSYKEAKRIENRLLNVPIQTSSAFVEVFDEYMSYLESSTKLTSLNKRISLFRNHIISYFNSIDLNKIDSTMVRKYKEYLSKKTICNNYKRHIMVELSSFFNFCVKYEYMYKNPSLPVKNYKKEKVQMKYWTIDEFKQFIKIVNEPMHELFFRLLFFTGMRRGEALGLTWNDINIETGEIDINKTCSHVSSVGYVISTPKTIESNRIVCLNSQLVELLFKYKSSLEENNKYNIKSHIFINNNKIIPKTTIDRVYRKYIKASGVKYIRIHDFRHSHIALLINLKQDPLSIAKRVGHVDVSVTLNTYGHLYNDRDKELASLLDDI